MSSPVKSNSNSHAMPFVDSSSSSLPTMNESAVKRTSAASITALEAVPKSLIFSPTSLTRRYEQVVIPCLEKMYTKEGFLLLRELLIRCFPSYSRGLKRLKVFLTRSFRSAEATKNEEDLWEQICKRLEITDIHQKNMSIAAIWMRSVLFHVLINEPLACAINGGGRFSFKLTLISCTALAMPKVLQEKFMGIVMTLLVGQAPTKSECDLSAYSKIRTWLPVERGIIIASKFLKYTREIADAFKNFEGEAGLRVVREMTYLSLSDSKLFCDLQRARHNPISKENAEKSIKCFRLQKPLLYSARPMEVLALPMPTLEELPISLALAPPIERRIMQRADEIFNEFEDKDYLESSWISSYWSNYLIEAFDEITSIVDLWYRWVAAYDETIKKDFENRSAARNSDIRLLTLPSTTQPPEDLPKMDDENRIDVYVRAYALLQILEKRVEKVFPQRVPLVISLIASEYLALDCLKRAADEIILK